MLENHTCFVEHNAIGFFGLAQRMVATQKSNYYELVLVRHYCQNLPPLITAVTLIALGRLVQMVPCRSPLILTCKPNGIASKKKSLDFHDRTLIIL